jgi:hypothetical protein
LSPENQKISYDLSWIPHPPCLPYRPVEVVMVVVVGVVLSVVVVVLVVVLIFFLQW